MIIIQAQSSFIFVGIMWKTLLHKFFKVTLNCIKWFGSGSYYETDLQELKRGCKMEGDNALTCGWVFAEFDEIATTANPFWTIHQWHQLISHILLPVKSYYNSLERFLRHNNTKKSLIPGAKLICSTANMYAFNSSIADSPHIHKHDQFSMQFADCWKLKLKIIFRKNGWQISLQISSELKFSACSYNNTQNLITA